MTKNDIDEIKKILTKVSENWVKEIMLVASLPLVLLVTENNPEEYKILKFEIERLISTGTALTNSLNQLKSWLDDRNEGTTK